MIADAEFEIAAVVASKRLSAVGVVVIELRDPSGGDLPGWQPGAHIDVMVEGLGVRQYSLSGDPDDRRGWRIGVLREEGGRGMSKHLHDDVSAGDSLRVRGPRNHFSLHDSRRYVFIAGGIGVTPILPMVRAAEAAGADWRLVYGGRRRETMAFLDELAEYGDKVTIRPDDEFGILDVDELLGPPEDDVLVYCCGPEPLLAAAEKSCASSWPANALNVERFTPKPVGTPGLSAPFEVVCQRSGLTLTVPPDESVLSVLEEAGVSVMSSCSAGTCGTCETAVVSGLPEHRDSVLTQEEQAANDCMMVCVSRSLTPVLVLDL